MADIRDLPLDLKTLILEQITDKADLKAACETCKDLYSVGIQILYKTISISEDIQIPKVSRMLSAENQGLKHVNHLRLTRPWNGNDWDKIDIDHYYHVMEMFTNHLPRGVLQTLTVDNSWFLESFSRKTAILDALHRRQPRLRTLRCIADYELRTPSCVQFQSLSTIQLFVTSFDDVSKAHHMLAAACNLEALKLCVNLNPLYRLNMAPGDDASLCDRLLRDLLGFSITSSGQPEAGNLTFSKLSTLQISGVDFASAASCIDQALVLPRLSRLALQKCLNVLSLLDALKESSSTLRISHLEIVQPPHSRLQANGDPGITDAFLGSFGNPGKSGDICT